MGRRVLIAIDTSAVVAILLGEPESAAFSVAIKAQPGFMSLTNVVEAESVMLRRRGPEAATLVRKLLASVEVELVTFDEGQARLAHAAYVRFGKGRHPARLNLGDCAAYALATSLDAPLLYKGDDFARTDVRAAV